MGSLKENTDWRPQSWSGPDLLKEVGSGSQMWRQEEDREFVSVVLLSGRWEDWRKSLPAEWRVGEAGCNGKCHGWICRETLKF